MINNFKIENHSRLHNQKIFELVGKHYGIFIKNDTITFDGIKIEIIYNENEIKIIFTNI
jgi:hypothetical protein